MNRRRFVRCSTICGLGMLGASGFEKLYAKTIPENVHKLYEAEYWEKGEDGKTICRLCPNDCVCIPGQDGSCHARRNINGKFVSLVHGESSIISSDSIQKTPLYHYEIESKAFSLATAGCNLSCKFCQNWKYSQSGPGRNKSYKISPSEVIARAKKNNMKAINFFYTEPVVYYEYMKDIAVLAKKEGMSTFCITAGYIHPDPLEELIPLIDAFAFGLKGFDNRFYEEYVGCKLNPIKQSLKILAEYKGKTWFEIVNLLIPGLNDKPESITTMSKWLSSEIGAEIPLHFTRFEPYYQMKEFSKTPLKTLLNAQSLARKEGLQYVYVGNMPGAEKANTYCPKCGKAVVERVGFKTISKKLKNGKCSCGKKIVGHWL